jgi:hypothetical protein
VPFDVRVSLPRTHRKRRLVDDRSIEAVMQDVRITTAPRYGHGDSAPPHTRKCHGGSSITGTTLLQQSSKHLISVVRVGVYQRNSSTRAHGVSPKKTVDTDEMKEEEDSVTALAKHPGSGGSCFWWTPLKKHAQYEIMYS